MKIRKASFADYQNIKTMMLTALKSDPDAFSIIYDEYANCSEYWWQNYLSDYITGLYSHMYFAEIDSEIIGMIGLNFSKKVKLQHNVDIVWVFIEKKHRGNGYSKKLLEYVEDVIKNRVEIMKISLNVISSQEKAINLYKKFGYSVSGNQRRHFKVDNTFFDLIIMEKHLGS